MRLLVTGASGFVGGRVATRLSDAGHQVTAMRGDVRDGTCHPAGPFDSIVHLASLITHGERHSRSEFFDVNVEGTERLLSSYPTAHFVYVSTRDVERDALGDYAESKLEAERRVCRRSRYCIVRLPSVFGPGQRQVSKLIPLLLRRYVLNGQAPEILDGARPCLFVDDAASEVCGCINRQGLVLVDGHVVHNVDLDNLVKAAARGEPPASLSPEHRRLFDQLCVCAEALRHSESSTRVND